MLLSLMMLVVIFVLCALFYRPFYLRYVMAGPVVDGARQKKSNGPPRRLLSTAAMARSALMSVALTAALPLAPMAAASALTIDAASDPSTTVTLPPGTYTAATVTNINGKTIVAGSGFVTTGALTFTGTILGAARIELSEVDVASISIGTFAGTGAGTAAGPLISVNSSKIQAAAGISVRAITGSVDVAIHDNEFNNGAQLTFAAVGATTDGNLAAVAITNNTFKAPVSVLTVNWNGVYFPSTVQSLKALVVSGNKMPAAPSSATVQYVSTAALLHIDTVTVTDNGGTCSAATCKAFNFGPVTFVSTLTVSRNTYTGASSSSSARTDTLTFSTITNVDTVAVEGNVFTTTQTSSTMFSARFGALLHGTSISVSDNVISATGMQYAYAGYVNGAVTNWTSVTFKGGTYTARTTSSFGADAVTFTRNIDTVDSLTIEGLTASATSHTFRTSSPYSARAVEFYQSVLNVKTFSIIHCDVSAVAPNHAFAVGVMGAVTNVDVLNITGRGGGVKAAPAARALSVSALNDQVPAAENEAQAGDTERTDARVVSALAGSGVTTVSASTRAVHIDGAMTNVKTIVVRGIQGSLNGAAAASFVKLGSSLAGGSSTFDDSSVPLSTDENSIVLEDLGFSGSAPTASGSIIIGSGGAVSFFKKIAASSIKMSATQTLTTGGKGFRMLYFTGVVSHVANNVTFTDVEATSAGYSTVVALYVGSFSYVGGVSVTHTTLVTSASAGISTALVVAGSVAHVDLFHASDLVIFASANAASTSVMCFNGAFTHSGALSYDRITVRATATQYSNVMDFDSVSNVSSITFSHMDTVSHANVSWGGVNVRFYKPLTDVGSISVTHSTIVAISKTSYTKGAPHHSARAVTFYSSVTGLGSFVVKSSTISASSPHFAVVVTFVNALTQSGTIVVRDSSLTSQATGWADVLRFIGAVTDVDSFEFDNLTLHARSHSQYANVLTWHGLVQNVMNISVSRVGADAYTNTSWGAYIGYFQSGIQDARSISFDACRFWARSQTSYTKRSPHYSARVIHFYSAVTRLLHFSVTNCVCHADAAYYTHLVSFNSIAGMESFIVKDNVLSARDRSSTSAIAFVTAITDVPSNFTLFISRNQFSTSSAAGNLRLAMVGSFTGNDTLWSPSEDFRSPSSAVSEPGLYFLENTFTLYGSATNGFVVGVLGTAANAHCMVMADNKITGTSKSSTLIMSAGGITNFRNVTIRDNTVDIALSSLTGSVFSFGDVSHLPILTVERCTVSLSTAGNSAHALTFTGAISFVDRIHIVDNSLRATTASLSATAIQFVGLVSNCNVIHIENTATFASAATHYATTIDSVGGIDGLKLMNLTNVSGTTSTGGWGSRAMYFHNAVRNMTSLLMDNTTLTVTAGAYDKRVPYHSAYALVFYSGVADVQAISLNRSTVTVRGTISVGAVRMRNTMSNVGLLELESSTVSAKSTLQHSHAITFAGDVADLRNFRVVNCTVTVDCGSHSAAAILFYGTMNRLYSYYVNGNTVRVKAKAHSVHVVFNTKPWTDVGDYAVVSNDIAVTGTSNLRSVGISAALSVSERVFVSGNSIDLTATTGDGHVGHFNGMNHLNTTAFIGNRITVRCAASCGIFRISGINNVSSFLLSASTLSVATTGSTANILKITDLVMHVGSFRVVNSTLESQAKTHYAYALAFETSVSDFGSIVIENSTLRSRTVSGAGAMAISFRTTITNGGHVNVVGNTIDVNSASSGSKAPHASPRTMYVYGAVSMLAMMTIVDNTFAMTGTRSVYGAMIVGDSTIDHLVLIRNRFTVACSYADARAIGVYGSTIASRGIIIEDNTVTVSGAGSSFVGIELGGVTTLTSTPSFSSTVASGSLPDKTLRIRRNTVTLSANGGNMRAVNAVGAITNATEVELSENVVSINGKGTNKAVAFVSFTHSDSVLIADNKVSVLAGSGATTGVSAGALTHVRKFSMVRNEFSAPSTGAQIGCATFGAITYVDEFEVAGLIANVSSSVSHVFLLKIAGVVSHGTSFAIRDVYAPSLSATQYAFGIVFDDVVQNWTSFFVDNVTADVKATTGWGAHFLRFASTVQSIAELNVSRVSGTVSAKTSYTTKSPYYSARGLEFVSAVTGITTMKVLWNNITCNGMHFVYCGNVHGRVTAVDNVQFIGNTFTATATSSDARTLNIGDFDMIKAVVIESNVLSSHASASRSYGAFFTDVSNVDEMRVWGNTVTASGPTALRTLFFQSISRCDSVVIDLNTATTKDTAATSYAMTIGAITHTPRVVVTKNTLRAHSMTASFTAALIFSAASDNTSFISVEGNTFEVTASKTADNYAMRMAVGFTSAHIEMRCNTFNSTGAASAALFALPTSLTDVDVIFTDNTLVGTTVAPFKSTTVTGANITLLTSCNTVQGADMAASVFTTRFTPSAVTSSITGICGTCVPTPTPTMTATPTFTRDAVAISAVLDFDSSPNALQSWGAGGQLIVRTGSNRTATLRLSSVSAVGGSSSAALDAASVVSVPPAVSSVTSSDGDVLLTVALAPSDVGGVLFQINASLLDGYVLRLPHGALLKPRLPCVDLRLMAPDTIAATDLSSTFTVECVDVHGDAADPLIGNTTVAVVVSGGDPGNVVNVTASSPMTGSRTVVRTQLRDRIHAKHDGTVDVTATLRLPTGTLSVSTISALCWEAVGYPAQVPTARVFTPVLSAANLLTLDAPAGSTCTVGGTHVPTAKVAQCMYQCDMTTAGITAPSSVMITGNGGRSYNITVAGTPVSLRVRNMAPPRTRLPSWLSFDPGTWRVQAFSTADLAANGDAATAISVNRFLAIAASVSGSAPVPSDSVTAQSTAWDIAMPGLSPSTTPATSQIDLSALNLDASVATPIASLTHTIDRPVDPRCISSTVTAVTAAENCTLASSASLIDCAVSRFGFTVTLAPNPSPSTVLIAVVGGKSCETVVFDAGNAAWNVSGCRGPGPQNLTDTLSVSMGVAVASGGEGVLFTSAINATFLAAVTATTPVVHSVSGCSLDAHPSTALCQADNTTVLTIAGAHFPASWTTSSISVSVDVNMPWPTKQCAVSTVTTTQILCTLPPGFGQNGTLTVTVVATGEPVMMSASRLHVSYTSLNEDTCAFTANGVCGGHGVCSPETGLCTCSSTPSDGFWYGVACDQCQRMYENSTGCTARCPGADNQPCTGHGVCSAGVCTSCEEPFVGANCSIRCPGGTRCSGHGTCSAINGTCTCHGNHTGVACDECVRSHTGASCEIECPTTIGGLPCSGHGQCQLRDAVAVCSCDGIFCGRACENVTCLECPTGRFGYGCAFECPGGASTPCNLHGTCSEGQGGSGLCTCNHGRYGAACDKQCPRDAETGAVCGGHGRCGADTDGCECVPTYATATCTVECPGTDANGTVCSGHGQCNSGADGDGSCTCVFGWAGDRCDTECPGGAASPCSFHGVCHHNASCVCNQNRHDGHWSGSSCDRCAHGYAGSRCMLQCPVGRPGEFGTAGAVCGGHGTCNDHGLCECSSSLVEGYWTGTWCDRCDSRHYGPQCRRLCPGSECDACSGHGTCDPSTGECTCVAGSVLTGNWVGAACDTCASGIFGARCTSLCPDCQRGVCSQGPLGDGQCICEPNWRRDASGSCTECLTGFFGSECTPCATAANGRKCSGNGRCSSGVGGDGTCACDVGYGGPQCDIECPIAHGQTCGGHGECTADGCRCGAGFGGVNCGNCASDRHGPLCDRPCSACLNGGTCRSGMAGDGSCQCPPEFVGALCEGACPLSNGTACGGHGACQMASLTPPTAVCQCHNNASYGFFVGEACGACLPAYASTTCRLPCPTVDGVVCNGRGTCFNGMCTACSALPADPSDIICGNDCGTFGAASCFSTTCRSGFWGAGCAKLCPGAAPDGSGACSGIASCNPDTGVCMCPLQNAGVRCELTCPVVTIDDRQRLCGHGTCAAVNVCVCGHGHWGPSCDRPCPGGGSNPCSGTGSCSAVTGQCACPVGLAGTACELLCPGGLHTPCGGHGQCREDATCDCIDSHIEGHFTGPACDRCVAGWGGGDCRARCSSSSETVGLHCGCFENSAGPTCSIPCPRAAGGGLVCSNRGVCFSGSSGNGTCGCDQHWFGTACEVRCVASTKCPHLTHAQCSPLGECECLGTQYGGFWAGDVCDDCAAGYWGPSCRLQCSCNGHGTCVRDTGECRCFGNTDQGHWGGDACITCRDGFIGATCQTVNAQSAPQHFLLTSVGPMLSAPTATASAGYATWADRDRQMSYLFGASTVIAFHRINETVAPEHLGRLSLLSAFASSAGADVIAMTHDTSSGDIVAIAVSTVDGSLSELRFPAGRQVWTATGPGTVSARSLGDASSAQSAARYVRPQSIAGLPSLQHQGSSAVTTAPGKDSTHRQVAQTIGSAVLCGGRDEATGVVALLLGTREVSLRRGPSVVGVAATSAVLDGVSRCSVGAGLLVLAGSKDGRWAVAVVPLPAGTPSDPLPTAPPLVSVVTGSNVSNTGTFNSEARSSIATATAALRCTAHPAAIGTTLVCLLRPSAGEALVVRIDVPSPTPSRPLVPSVGCGSTLQGTTPATDSAAIAFDGGSALVALAVNGKASEIQRLKTDHCSVTSVAALLRAGSQYEQVHTISVDSAAREALVSISVNGAVQLRSYNLFGLTGVAPAVLDAAGGTLVTVTGEGFANLTVGDATSTVCVFDGGLSVEAILRSPTEIHCVAPTRSTPASGNTQCTSSLLNVRLGLRSTAATNTPYLQVATATATRAFSGPRAVPFSPAEATAVITVTGTGFTPSASATCRLRGARSVTLLRRASILNSTTALCTVPSGLPATFPPTLLEYSHDGSFFGMLPFQTTPFALVGVAAGVAVLSPAPGTPIPSGIAALVPPIAVAVVDVNRNPLWHLDTERRTVRAEVRLGRGIAGPRIPLAPDAVSTATTVEGGVTLRSLALGRPSVGAVTLLVDAGGWYSTLVLGVVPGVPALLLLVTGPLAGTSSAANEDAVVAANIRSGWVVGATAEHSLDPAPEITVTDAAGNDVKDSSVLPVTASVRWQASEIPPGTVHSTATITRRRIATMASLRYSFGDVKMRGVHGGSYSLTFEAAGAARLTVALPVQYCSNRTEYGELGTTRCLPCPPLGICDGGTEIRPRPGAWRSRRDSYKIYSCTAPHSAGSCDEDGLCIDGYHGARCSVCDEGYAKVGLKCTKCGAAVWNWVLLSLMVLVIIVVLYALVYVTVKTAQRAIRGDVVEKDMISIAYKMLVNHLQVAAICALANDNAGTVLDGFFGSGDTASSISLDLSFVACTLAGAYRAQLTVVALAPAALVVVLAFIRAVQMTVHRQAQRLSVRPTAGITGPVVNVIRPEDLRLLALQEPTQEVQVAEARLAVRIRQNRRALAPRAPGGEFTGVGPTHGHTDAKGSNGKVSDSEPLSDVGWSASSVPSRLDHPPSALTSLSTPIRSPAPHTRDGLLSARNAQLSRSPSGERYMMTPTAPKAIPLARPKAAPLLPPPAVPSNDTTSAVDTPSQLCTPPPQLSSSNTPLVDTKLGTDPSTDDVTLQGGAKEMPRPLDSQASILSMCPVSAEKPVVADGALRKRSVKEKLARRDVRIAAAVLEELEAVKADTDNKRRPAVIEWLEFVAVAVVVVLFMLYPTIVETAAEVYRCEEIDYGASGVRSLLVADRSVDCDSAEYTSLLGVAVPVLLGYGLGLPIAMVLLVLVFSKLTLRNRMGSAIQLFGYVTGGYREDRWWWETTIFARKFLLSVIAVVVTSNRMRGYAMSWVMAASVVAAAVFKSYESEMLTTAEAASLATIMATTNVLLLYDFYTEDDDPAAFWSVTVFVMVLNILTLVGLLVVILFALRLKLAALAATYPRALGWARDYLLRVPTSALELMVERSRREVHSQKFITSLRHKRLVAVESIASIAHSDDASPAFREATERYLQMQAEWPHHLSLKDPDPAVLAVLYKAERDMLLALMTREDPVAPMTPQLAPQQQPEPDGVAVEPPLVRATSSFAEPNADAPARGRSLFVRRSTSAAAEFVSTKLEMSQSAGYPGAGSDATAPCSPEFQVGAPWSPSAATDAMSPPGPQPRCHTTFSASDVALPVALVCKDSRGASDRRSVGGSSAFLLRDRLGGSALSGSIAGVLLSSSAVEDEAASLHGPQHGDASALSINSHDGAPEQQATQEPQPAPQ